MRQDGALTGLKHIWQPMVAYEILSSVKNIPQISLKLVSNSQKIHSRLLAKRFFGNT